MLLLMWLLLAWEGTSWWYILELVATLPIRTSTSLPSSNHLTAALPLRTERDRFMPPRDILPGSINLKYSQFWYLAGYRFRIVYPYLISDLLIPARPDLNWTTRMSLSRRLPAMATGYRLHSTISNYNLWLAMIDWHWLLGTNHSFIMLHWQELHSCTVDRTSCTD